MVKHPKHHFSHFLDDPIVSLAFLAFGLVALILSILDFSKAVGY